MPFGKKERHESYGMLQFNRISGGNGTPLFGSSITHQNTIRLTIGPGVIERDLNHDWYFKEGQDYISVEMSQSQFAEAISSMNMGSGVPVTVKRLNGKMMKEPNFVNKRIQFEKEFEEKMEKLSNKLGKLTEETEDLLKNKKSISKGDREVILRQIQSLRTEIQSNIPFVAAQYNEQLDKTTIEAKAEMEAFTQNKITQLGLSKLEDLKTLAGIEQQQKETKMIE